MSIPLILTSPGGTGGSATPGGNSGDIQFNNAGALGGETLVPLANGGTAADLSASGGTTAVLAQDASHVITARNLVAADVPNLDAAKITTGLLALARGGTNADLSATGGASKFLKQAGVGSAVTVVQPAFSDLSGVATWPQLPVANQTGGITFGVAASATNTAGTTQALSLAIAQGDCVVVAVNNASSIVNAIVRDDGGNSYSHWITSNSTAGQGALFICLNAKQAATQVFVAGGTGNVSIAAATYKGVKSATTYTSVGQTGPLTAGSVTVATTVANSFLVVLFSWFKTGSAITIAANVGNLRTSIGSSGTTTTAGVGIADRTQVGTGSLNVAVTANVTTAWAEGAIELIPA